MTNSSVDPSLYSSDYFLERCGGIEFFRKYRQTILKPSIQVALIRANLNSTDRILDVGCGRGELVAHLHDKGFNVIGIDYSQAAIECAKQFFPQAQYQVVRSDQQNFESQSFDKIFLLGIIEHLYEPEVDKTLAEIKRLLKPGGRCVITTCTNLLYYKTQTYRLRLQIAKAFKFIGIGLRLPRPPRNEDDELAHINEKHYFSLRSSLLRTGWPFVIEPRPNPKLASAEIYGTSLPFDFPLRAKPRWVQIIYGVLFKFFPINLFFARSYVITLKCPH